MNCAKPPDNIFSVTKTRWSQKIDLVSVGRFSLVEVRDLGKDSILRFP